MDDEKGTRKRLEEESAELRRRLEAAFDLSPVPMTQTRLTDRTFVAVNDAFLRDTGFAREEVLGKTPEDMRIFVDPEELARIAATVRASKTAYGQSVRMRRKTGELRTCLFSSTLVLVGGVPHALSSILDVTERERAEAALRGSEERFALAFQTSPYAITITRAEDGKFVDVNEAFTTISGYTRDEALADSSIGLHLWVNVEDRNRVVTALRAGAVVSGEELPFRRKTGELVTGLFAARMIRLSQGPCILSSISDITRVRALEAQLLQAQKMDGIGRLAGGVAHDFNNLISVILGCTEFALAGPAGGAELRQNLLDIRGASERAAALTRQLLAFSRKQVLRPEPVDLNRILAAMEQLLRRIIGEDVELVRNGAADLGWVKADKHQLEQVIMNLTTNARDAMPHGGKLTLETANVELDADHVARHEGAAPGPHVMVAIRDTGAGMDAATRERIFEPFFTTRGALGGTGLGLSTAYGIVRQSGGSISVESEPGRGTTFRIYLPREAPQAVEAAPAEVPEGPAALERRTGGSETVLVVEDDDGVRLMTRRILETAGYTVLAAANGGAALAVCGRHQETIHLMLTDVVMPRMSGRELAERLAGARPGMKVLYMSGYTDDAIVHHGVLDPGTRFIGKPFNREELLRAVREALGVPPDRG